MKKIEFVYREVLYQFIEKKNKTLTQSELAKTLKISLSTVNLALKPLVKMNSVKVNQRNFDVIDAKKILYYWASTRNIEKDAIYKTRVEKPVRKIESEMPDTAVYAAYSAYRMKFGDVPADYSEVYVYGDEEIEKRFPKNINNPNLFVLKKDSAIDKYGKSSTTAQLFADLWNLREWYAKDFLKALEKRLNGILE
ncbi:MAG: winged helix-turn-helix transcriptional regulator [Candidatus Woesearchaeota archaeon]|nr:winged helix-turn-helix transcriptional regulator [Candidatus Woesearchaeota archaeon]